MKKNIIMLLILSFLFIGCTSDNKKEVKNTKITIEETKVEKTTGPTTETILEQGVVKQKANAKGTVYTLGDLYKKIKDDTISELYNTSIIIKGYLEEKPTEEYPKFAGVGIAYNLFLIERIEEDGISKTIGINSFVTPETHNYLYNNMENGAEIEIEVGNLIEIISEENPITPDITLKMKSTLWEPNILID